MTKEEFIPWISILRPKIMALANIHGFYLRDGEQEDVAQDVLLHLWECIHQYEGRNGASFGTWVYRVSINHLRDRHRRALVQHRNREVRWSKEIADQATWIPNYEDRIFALQIVAILEKSRKLPRAQRRVLGEIVNGTYDSHRPGAKKARWDLWNRAQMVLGIASV